MLLGFYFQHCSCIPGSEKKKDNSPDPLLKCSSEAPFSIFHVHFVNQNHVTWPPSHRGSWEMSFLCWAHGHPKHSQVLCMGRKGRGALGGISRVSPSRNLEGDICKCVSLRYKRKGGRTGNESWTNRQVTSTITVLFSSCQSSFRLCVTAFRIFCLKSASRIPCWEGLVWL